MFSRLRKKLKFRVVIEAGNLLMDVDGVRRMGYFTTRFVDGFDSGEAAESALNLARNELNSYGVLLNELNDPPVLGISEVTQLNSFKGLKVPGRGFTFFPEEETL
jgi:hypothetical protein